MHRILQIAAVSALFAAMLAAGLAGAPPAQPPATRPAPPTKDAIKFDRVAEITATGIDRTHGGEKWRSHAIAQCDFVLRLGKTAAEGRFTFQINGSGVRFDMKDGTAFGFDGRTCWVVPAGNTMTQSDALERLLGWRLMLASPFAIRDPSAKISAFRAALIAGRDVDSYKITHIAGPKAPEVLFGYGDVRTRKLAAIGGPPLAAMLGWSSGGDAKPATSIVFSDLQDADGALLPMTWTMYDWTESGGPRGDALGTVKLSKLKFLHTAEAQFASPAETRQEQPASSAPATRPG